jgi:hypothetical protein
MTRRELIALLGSTAVSWPLRVLAQQTERMRRVGMLTGRNAAWLQGLAQLGWTEGYNVQIDIRWGGGDAERDHIRCEPHEFHTGRAGTFGISIRKPIVKANITAVGPAELLEALPESRNEDLCFRIGFTERD